LYGRTCKTPLNWDGIEDRFLARPESIQEMEEQMKTMKGILKKVQDRQKSYVNV